jgi:hypothetical protein
MASALAGHENHLSIPLKYVQTPDKGVSCPKCPSQDNPNPRCVRRYSPITYWHLPGSYRGHVKGRILSYLTLTLYLCLLPRTTPISAIGPLPRLSLHIPHWLARST